MLPNILITTYNHVTSKRPRTVYGQIVDIGSCAERSTRNNCIVNIEYILSFYYISVELFLLE